ncbi:MAG: hypothetical protein JSW06_04560 [Thermoplasmatales archaeon]|nr:MAG: hypothetical protein JSW06_04560 [Thermoplasmatales archaeon]
MKKSAISICICMLLIIPILSTTGIANQPPETPNITGPSSGKPGVEYDFNFSTIDPDGDDVYYCVSWGCCGSGDFHTYGPYESGVEVTLSHSWPEQGGYTIQAYAKDIYDAESDIATLEISIPLTHHIINTLFLRFFERFPNAFPILRYLLRL